MKEGKTKENIKLFVSFHASLWGTPTPDREPGKSTKANYNNKGRDGRVTRELNNPKAWYRGPHSLLGLRKGAAPTSKEPRGRCTRRGRKSVPTSVKGQELPATSRRGTPRLTPRRAAGCLFVSSSTRDVVAELKKCPENVRGSPSPHAATVCTRL